MARYIDADLLLERIYPYNGVDKSKYAINAKAVFEAIRKSPTADVVPKSDVERLEEALADKAREYNMVVDKICLEHRAEYARLHEAHQEELAKAKREVARKIFADIEFLIDKYSLEPNYLLLHLKKDIAEFKKQHNKN